MPPYSQRTANAIIGLNGYIPLIRPANMKMSDPSQDPNSWIAMWHSLPDTLRASILGLLLALIMAFKQDGRTLGERITDVLATPVLVVISGYSLQAMGFSESLVFVLAGVFAGYGIGPVKAVLKRWLEKKVDNA